MTFKGATDLCIQLAKDRLESSDDDAVRRNMAVAITHLEDAQMRYGRGRAIELGVFAPFDFDRHDRPGDVAEALSQRDALAKLTLANAVDPKDEVGDDPEPAVRHEGRRARFPA